MLQVSHIVKNFGRIKALQDVTLNIGKGEFFGLLGPNGAGKTTLINIIVGYLKPDEGVVSLGDEMMVYDNVELRKKIGYVPQELALYLELSTYHNLRIFGRLYGLDSDMLEKRIDEVLELVQLTDRKKDKVKNFSGGMKRRLNLAASILHNPDLILCDEPTVGVDPQSRNAIFDMLINLNREGKTILYTTHYMEEAEKMCTRLAIIDYGNIIAKGTLQELINLLDAKKTVKVQKMAGVNDKLPQLDKLGTVNEMDFSYEIIPNENYLQNSKLFASLEECGIPNEAIELNSASLEDVFLNLTGRSLRD